MLVFNKKPNKRGEVLIYEEIGANFWTGEGVTAKRFATGLKDLGTVDEIDVRINSPGGTVFDGLAIYNQLKQHKATVNVFIDGVALSMASGIAMAGDNISMAKNGLMMMHNPQAFAMGDENELNRTLKMLQTTKDSLAVAYADKSGKTADEIKNIMGDETWLTAEQAKEAGFVDEIMDEVANVAACVLPASLKVPVAHAAAINSFAKDFQMPKANDNAQPQAVSTDTAPVVTAPVQNVATPARVHAELGELEALNGATPEFVVEQLKAKATLAEAVNALNGRLANQLKEAREASNQKVIQPQPGIGVKALTNDGQPPDAPQQLDFQETKDAINLEVAKIRNRDARRFKVSDAMREVRRSHPQLFT